LAAATNGATASNKPDDDTVEVPFKSGQRTNIEKESYTIIANIGDQRSDLAGDAVATFFK
jgi:hypothetical protein